jgi:ParB family chromosome partitioning protein
MSERPPEIRSIPVGSITVLNPRARNRRVFNELVTSIANIGLKKPITVSQRKDNDGYDLVCGEGRLEAFIALGQTEIPAIVISVSKEDCFVMSLVENVARRQHSPLELIREIGALKERGYSHSQIASKIDFSPEYVCSICYLLEHGEERLVTAVERGIMPHTVAIEIARAKDADVQQALADAYESGTIPGNQVLGIRSIIEQRIRTGKSIHSIQTGARPAARKVTAVGLVRTYRKETERQKLLVKKATLAQRRLLFIVNALRRLLAEDHFTTLLRAEVMHSVPRPLAERMERGSL